VREVLVNLEKQGGSLGDMTVGYCNEFFSMRHSYVQVVIGTPIKKRGGGGGGGRGGNVKQSRGITGRMGAI